MKKKIYYILILFIVIFIGFSLSSNVFALDGYYMDTYNKGDAFKFVKDAYKYKYKEKWFNNNFEQDGDEIYFKKGEIVKYTGNWNTSGIINIVYYMEVEHSDGRKGYINCVNVEPYELSRPSTVSQFISKYDVDSCSSYTELTKKITNRRIYK